MNPLRSSHVSRLRPLLALALIGLAGAPVWAQPAKPAAVTSGSPARAAAPRPPNSVRFIKAPSDETPAARARRLKRECKGKPNAGMCLGHAS
jgi:hypothetical protein